MVAMEHVGIEVVAVRPYDCAKFGIYVHLTEVGGVLQWLGHRSPKITGEIDLADEAIGKGQPQSESVQRLHGGNASKHATIVHGGGSAQALAASTFAVMRRSRPSAETSTTA